MKGAREIVLRAGGSCLGATMTVPNAARAVVVFAHGSGSSRFSPRNIFVAEQLNAGGFATLLMDLLTLEEEEEERITRHHRFDIELLSARLTDAIAWVAHEPELSGTAVGLFGASTGAAAALVAASASPQRVGAVVSRGGRPDLAGEALASVKAPTLLIVGSRDPVVIDLNEGARDAMKAPVELRIVAGASHLFEEPGTLEEVAGLAEGWFAMYL